MEMLKTFAEIRTGDIVRRELGGPAERVLGTLRMDSGVVFLTLSAAVCAFALASTSIILVHRPWPEGKTPLDFLHEIARLGRLVQPGQLKSGEALEKAISELRQTCEEFELGKPEEPQEDSDTLLPFIR